MEGPTVARGNNYGSHTWSGRTIGGAVFGPAGPLAAQTTYGVTDHKIHAGGRMVIIIITVAICP